MSDTFLDKINVILDDYGYSEDSFDITEKDTAESGDDAAPTTSIVVTHKTTGKEKNYLTDKYALWVADFERDLQEEYFE